MSYINPRAKVFQHLDHLVALRDGRKPVPVNVEIDLSNRCDLKCAGCHFAYTHTRGPWAGKADKPLRHIDGGDLMPLPLALSMLDQLAAAGVKSVTWTGGGEPTLHPYFDTIVRHAAHRGLQQGIYTHGGHISAERADLLKTMCAWVYISLDAANADAYLAYKGVNRYDRVLAGMHRLVNAPGQATLGVGYLLSRDNYREQYNMVQAVRGTGVDYVQFRPLVLYAQDDPGAPAEDTAWITDCVALLRQWQGDPFVIADLDRFLAYRDWQGHGYATCRWSALQTVITPNGKVWRCTNTREHPDALLGDLATEPFAALWARAGGPCAVTAGCRVLCRGHIANQTLDGVLRPTPHANFV